MGKDCSQRHNLSATISSDQEGLIKVINKVGLMKSDTRYREKNCSDKIQVPFYAYELFRKSSRKIKLMRMHNPSVGTQKESKIQG